MSRTTRLLDLMQLLRRHRYPIAGAVLARDLGVSLRTLYRDIATLQAQGAVIEGEPGMGYVLRPGYLLPPLMFSAEEIESLVLGARWVARRADSDLGAAAANALAKIASVLPSELRADLDASALLVGPAAPLEEGTIDLAALRAAIRGERKLDIDYLDQHGTSSTRVVWPFALGFFEHARVMIAWCEQRQAFRHFRTDRVARMEVLAQRYPQRRQALLKTWRETEGIAPS